MGNGCLSHKAEVDRDGAQYWDIAINGELIFVSGDADQPHLSPKIPRQTHL